MVTRMATVATPDVPDAFDAAAPSYDLMVALNPGYHAHLRSAAEALTEKMTTTSRRLVDLGCGSGASTRALIRSLRGQAATVTGVDGSAGMLLEARAKQWPAGTRFAHSRAEDLGAARNDLGLTQPQDGILSAYLFRNVTDRDKVLRECHELLAPGGVLVVQEYSVAASRAARAIWTAVCWSVVIPLSLVVNRDTSLYRYLWRSVLDFDTVEEFTDRMIGAGFVDVEVRTVAGWQRGILHTIRGRRGVTAAPLIPPDAHPLVAAAPSAEGATATKGCDEGLR